MPKALHDKLVRQALKKGLSGEEENSYVYSTLEKIKKQRKRKSSK
jgi:hypothetical protein